MTTTYSTLVSDIQNYTENTGAEFINSIPRFVDNAELRIHREIDSDRFRKYATTSTTANVQYLATPSDMIVDRWMKVSVAGVNRSILPKDASFITTFWPDATLTGIPRFYGNWDSDTLVLAPTPDDDYTVTLGYTRRLAPLTVSNQTNFLTSRMPDALLYACLVEAYQYMKDEGKNLSFWQGEYARARDSIKQEEESRMRREESRYGEIR